MRNSDTVAWAFWSVYILGMTRPVPFGGVSMHVNVCGVSVNWNAGDSLLGSNFVWLPQ